MINFAQALAKVLDHDDLTRTEACDAFNFLIDNSQTPEKISAFLIALKMKGESVDEIAGFADSLTAQAVGVSVRGTDVIDVCGTGGDRSNTFNVSTTVSFVLAAAGQLVAKHGNRSVSSRSGSFDLLEALGVGYHSDSQSVQRAIDNYGIAFLFAPAFHPSAESCADPAQSRGFDRVKYIGPTFESGGAS